MTPNLASTTSPSNPPTKLKPHIRDKFTNHAQNDSASESIVSNHVLHGTLNALNAAAFGALKEIPPASIELVLADEGLDGRLPAVALAETVDLGKAHVSFAIVSLLYRELPANVLSRGSLTVPIS
jgi:hypothetical protein